MTSPLCIPFCGPCGIACYAVDVAGGNAVTRDFKQFEYFRCTISGARVEVEEANALHLKEKLVVNMDNHSTCFNYPLIIIDFVDLSNNTSFIHSLELAKKNYNCQLCNSKNIIFLQTTKEIKTGEKLVMKHPELVVLDRGSHGRLSSAIMMTDDEDRIYLDLSGVY